MTQRLPARARVRVRVCVTCLLESLDGLGERQLRLWAKGQRRAVVEADLLTLCDWPVGAQRRHARQQQVGLGACERHEGDRRVGVVARVMIRHGCRALRVLRRVLAHRQVEAVLICDARRHARANISIPREGHGEREREMRSMRERSRAAKSQQARPAAR
eukprot:4404045-Pleurochrysis_carterae.AAC.1